MSANESELLALMDQDSSAMIFTRPDQIHCMVRLTYVDKDSLLHAVEAPFLRRHFKNFLWTSEFDVGPEKYAQYVSNLFLTHKLSIESMLLDKIENLELVSFEILDGRGKGMVFERNPRTGKADAADRPTTH